jgi:hypothetical protein
MRTFVTHIAIVGATAGCMMMAVPVAATAQGTDSAANPAPAHPSIPPALHLSDAQRAQIRAAVDQENSDVNFNSADTKSAATFQPAVGAKLPKGVTAHALPRPLIYQLPALREYTYVKFRDQILILNSVTREIVDIIPQS